jgi:hypothetical protein
MKYALLIYSQPESQNEEDNVAGSPSVGNGSPDTWIDFTRSLKNAGALLGLERLQGVDTATSVRVRDGERLLTDGPFIETKEHLLGFYLIEAPDLDAALDWAADMPHVRRGTAEVRPVMDVPALAQIARE